ncbi:MAG: hypothetical protein MJ232_06765 [archaeon]|nr:hypothetical protein [archaeon]
MLVINSLFLSNADGSTTFYSAGFSSNTLFVLSFGYSGLASGFGASSFFSGYGSSFFFSSTFFGFSFKSYKSPVLIYNPLYLKTLIRLVLIYYKALIDPSNRSEGFEMLNLAQLSLQEAGS